MNKKIAKAMPTALFISGVVGIVVSEVLAVRGGMKAEKILHEVKTVLKPGEDPEKVPAYYHTNEKGFQESQIIVTTDTKKEYIMEVTKATWKCFVPAAVTGVLTIASFIVSRRLTTKQIAALSTMLVSTGGLVARYRDEIKERYGEDVLTEIDKKVGEENKHFVANNIAGEAIEGDDYITVHDKFTGVTFETTKMAFVTAKYLLNQTFAMGSTVPLKMFYNIQGADLPYEYDSYGWSWEDFNDGYIWIDITLTKKGDHYEMEYDYDPFEGVTA